MIGPMSAAAYLTASLGLLLLAPARHGDGACRYMKSHGGLSGYETGGPYKLDPLRLTKGRTELREFLWKHWREHKKGVAEALEMTIDAGTFKVLYLIQSDAQGSWGIDVELDRPLSPPCITLHADSLVRLPIDDATLGYLSQTGGLWPPGEIPKGRLADSEVIDSKSYRIVLVVKNKPVGSDII